MKRPISMARLDLGWPLAGIYATLFSVATLGAIAVFRGLPLWAPLNVTSHILHGQEVTLTALDLRHTGLGATIHVVSCFFWSAIAVLVIRRATKSSGKLAWSAGLSTATIAGVIDYGFLPRQLSPGWELMFPPLGVAAGLIAMGTGISLGLMSAAALWEEGETVLPPKPATEPLAEPVVTHPSLSLSPLERLRHPKNGVLEQRQTRIDPANTVTDDPNLQGNSMKQPGEPKTVEGNPN